MVWRDGPSNFPGVILLKFTDVPLSPVNYHIESCFRFSNWRILRREHNVFDRNGFMLDSIYYRIMFHRLYKITVHFMVAWHHLCYSSFADYHIQLVNSHLSFYIWRLVLLGKWEFLLRRECKNWWWDAVRCFSEQFLNNVNCYRYLRIQNGNK